MKISLLKLGEFDLGVDDHMKKPHEIHARVKRLIGSVWGKRLQQNTKKKTIIQNDCIKWLYLP
jgi:hypothetical protein